ncbi:hypothetical protein T11_12237, partial [Trichinella zimbabwensis]
LVEVLILYGTLTPHLPGSPAARLGLSPLMAPEACLRQLQVVWRSAVVLAALLRDLTPLQQAAGTAPPLF